MVRFNFFAERGAFTRDANGHYRVDMPKMRQAVDDLSAVLLKLQGDGDYAGVQQLTRELGVIRPAAAGRPGPAVAARHPGGCRVHAGQVRARSRVRRAAMGAVLRVLDGRPRDLGGFGVRRVLPAGGLQTVGPFIFFDHMGPAAFAPGAGVDVRPHPHIGLATVTYLFAGEFMHRDSLGTAQLIRPGDVNWMVAGRGIVHSERTPPEARGAAGGAVIHGIQTWVALPREREEIEPSFEHHPAPTLPEIHARRCDACG